MLQERLSSGISGLDEVLHGGLIPSRAYLVRGGPGSGKTTLGLHFLAAGVPQGEKTLLITLGEPEARIRENAQSLNLKLEGITFLDLSPSIDFFSEVQTYDIFSPAEVEREPTTQKIIQEVEALKPARVFIDSMTQFRYLSTDSFQFRKQVLSFFRFLLEAGATVLFTSETSPEAPDDDLQFMSDGVINLEFTTHKRTLNVSKFRGSNFRDGSHSMRLTDTGLVVFPRLLPETYKRVFAPESLPCGVPELDELLHGGLERGTVTLFSGPSGVGKTTIGLQFMKEAAGRGERSVVYTFEEEVEIILHRCQAINIPARAMVERGTLSVMKVEPLKFSPDEFANLVRHDIEMKKTQIVMIDSISGYQLSVQGEDLLGHLHALCKYLANVGVTVILINEVQTLAGEFKASEHGITYLADNLIFLRYLERRMPSRVEMRKAICVLKKRLTDFEKTMREIEITRYGIKVGKVMPGLQGILYGMPVWDESNNKHES